MPLQNYHIKHQSRTDFEIEQRIKAKEEELNQIFQAVSVDFESNPVKIAILGCIDRRYIPAHKILFEKFLGKPVTITTFDVTTEHLQGEDGVIQHDCTLPLPNPPYDITFGHLVLKFIETDKQWRVLENSYNALGPGGLAIHLLDAVDYQMTERFLPGGGYSVPLERWKEKLATKDIQYRELLLSPGPNMSSLALLLLKR